MRRLSLCIFTCAMTTASISVWADWPQYRGPNSDGTSAEKMLTSWPRDGPRVLWKLDAREAFGSFAIQGEKAYFISMTNESEVCYAIDLGTGKGLWAATLDDTIMKSSGGIGPRSTPVAEGGRIYTYGTYLKLACLNAADGKVAWEHDIAKEFNGQLQTKGINQYGSACSPIVEGNLVIVAGGGPDQAFLAFDKKTGKVAWQKESDLITHATPTPATIGGVRQVIFFTKSGLVSLEAKSGNVLWRFAVPSSRPVGASPVVGGDIVYCSAGYGLGAAACRVTNAGGQFSAHELWRDPDAMNHWSTPVVRDGFLYGLYGAFQMDNAPLKCIELATGKEKWSGPAFGQGEGKLIVQGSRGQLVLVDPSPEGYKEISRTQVLGGKAWGFPAYGHGILLHRTDKQVAALDLSAS